MRAGRGVARLLCMRILLVEYDAPTALGLSMLFRLRQHAVEVAGSVREARHLLLDAARFDAVFCDLALPDGDGLELAAEARSLGIPAVSLSYGSTNQAARRAGCVGHLCKPIEANAVDLVLRELADAGSERGRSYERVREDYAA